MQSDNPRAIKAREERAFYVSIGLCPRCGKSRLFGEEKTCPECRLKATELNRKYRREHSEKVREYINKYHKSLYHQRKEAGMCVRCGKRKPLYNDLRCGICKEKMTLRRQERRVRDGRLTRKERLEQGFCYFCGAETVSGMKVCEKHRQVCIENGNKSSREIQKNTISCLFPRKD